MSRIFRTNVDFTNNQLLQAIMETIAGNPGGSIVDGRIWYDSTAATVKARLNGVTIDLRARATHTGTITAATVSDFTTAVQAIRWASMQPPNAAVAMNSQQFSGLAAASTGGQAVEWAQFQTALAQIQVGMDFKEHAEIAALVNTVVATPGATINGRTMAAGDRVLLTAQTTPSQNGLWMWGGAAVAMTRPADSPTGNTSAIVAGTVVESYNGTARVLYMQTATGTGANASIIVDTDAQVWTNPFSFSVTAGYGVTVVGSKVGFNPGPGMAAVGADGAAAGVDLTVIPQYLTGTIPTATGGIFTVAGAVSGFQAVTINHALNNTVPLLVLRYGSAGADPGQQVEVDNKPPTVADANNLVVTLPAGYAANEYNFMIVG